MAGWLTTTEQSFNCSTELYFMTASAKCGLSITCHKSLTTLK